MCLTILSRVCSLALLRRISQHSLACDLPTGCGVPVRVPVRIALYVKKAHYINNFPGNARFIASIFTFESDSKMILSISVVYFVRQARLNRILSFTVHDGILINPYMNKKYV